jgi:aminopeptidase N
MPGVNLTRSEASERATHLAVDTYRVHLDVTQGREHFIAITAVSFSCSVEGYSTFIDVVADRIIAATLNGVELEISSFDGESLFIDGLATTNELVVEAEMLFSKVGEGLQLSVDPVDNEVYLYSMGETAHIRKMYPCFDQPDLKAVFSLTVTAPSHWEVLSNSPVSTSTIRGGSKVVQFADTPRISTYITAMVAGPYARLTDEYRGKKIVPLGMYARKSLAEFMDPDDVFLITKQGFAYFEEVFGIEYPFEKYDQIAVVDYNWGAMENSGCVTFLEELLVFRSKVTDRMFERRAHVILHEMAHMWFGNLVTMKWWDDLWLNESFAEWASALALSECTRFTESWTGFNIDSKNWAYSQDQLTTTHPIITDMFDIETAASNFDGISYAKGASVLAQLVHYCGREEFLAGLRAYFTKHAWGNTTLDDLLEALTQSSGRDLTPWVDTWLRTAGVNTLRPIIMVDSTQQKYSSFTILQEAPLVPTGSEELRPHRLSIGLFDIKNDHVVRRLSQEIDIAGKSTDVPSLVGESLADLILINDKDLSYGKWRLDERSIQTLRTHLGKIDDSLARAICWSSAWDMTRDAEIATSEWIDIALAWIKTERHISSVTGAGQKISLTIENYASPAHRALLKEKSANALYEILLEEDPGSDRQLQISKIFASLAVTKEQVKNLQGILDGSLNGLVIDTDLKWVLATALAENGALHHEALEKLLAEDDTIPGNAAFQRGLAAQPSLAAKERAWSDIYNKETGTQLRQALMSGFQRPSHRELLSEFVEPYFGALLPTWDEHGFEMAASIVKTMYPHHVITEEVLEKTDSWLSAHHDAPPALLRYLHENRDSLARSLKAQAKDFSHQ